MTPRRAAARWALVAGLLCVAPWVALAPAARGQSDSLRLEEPAIAAATGFVNDRAGVMDEATRARLEAFLDQVRRKTGAEFAVLTVRTTAPLTPRDYKVRVFEQWGIGRKGADEGLLLLVALDEREVWFETGYGLEGTLPDGLEARIVRERMAPRFRDGDFSEGIVAGVLAAASRIAAAKGVTLEWDGRELRYDRVSRPRVPIAVALLIVFIILIVAFQFGRGGGSGGTRPRRYRRLGGPFMMGGPWGGTGGGWGGGFGGGSFGGFGGGASGGGGGGGRW